MYGQDRFSHTAARIMRVGSSIMLIPAGFGVLLATLVCIMSAVSLSTGGMLLGILPIAVAAVGITLLIGYHKHARHTLDDRKQSALWITTAIFNAVPLVPTLYSINGERIPIFDEPGILMFTPFVLWWAIAVLMSICSLIDDRKSQKYR